MGICCLRNRPLEKFIGVWTDDKYVELNIEENGTIQYRKQTEHSNTNMNGSSRFTDEEFFYCFCCCCCLRGRYIIDDDSQPKIIANGILLTKK